MTSLPQDFRYGFRMIRKSPGFAATAILVLALGIGANTAIFSVVNGVLLRPLPFSDPDQLVRIWHTPPAKNFPGINRFSVSAANFYDWQQQSTSFDSMSIYNFFHADLAGEKPQVVRICRVTDGFFSVFRAQPQLGRVFTADEDRPGRGHVLILSQALWKSQFGGDPNIIGRKIDMDGESYTIVGVAQPNFRYPDWAQAWQPMAWSDQEKSVRGEHHSVVVARLKPGATQKQAQAEIDAISARLSDQYPADDKGWGAIVVPMHADMIGDVRPALLVLLGAVGFVLLIACANVANLLLAKTLARQKETAIRAVLGASSGRIVRQIVVETLLLSASGGLLGWFIAQFGVSAIAAFFGDNLPKLMDISPDAWVLGFTLLISIATGVAAGLFPAWRLTKSNINEALKSGLGRTDADTSGNRARSILVVSEVALSLILLAGAGLMIRSLWNLRRVNPGFDPHNVLTMSLPVTTHEFPTRESEISFYNELFARLQALPGVESAAAIDSMPLNGEGGSVQPVQIEGRPVVAMADQPEVGVRFISAGYTRTMHIPLIAGRELTDADAPGAQDVVLVSETMARRFWPNESPLGKHLTLSFFPGFVRTVAGVVGDVKDEGLDDPQTTGTLYFPIKQLTQPPNTTWSGFSMGLAVRSSTPVARLTPEITAAIHQLVAEQPVEEIATMEDLIATSLTQQRFNMLLLASFAGLAMLLAAVGIYSVLSYAVRRRTREIGIRMALGAQVRDVLRLVVADGMKPTLLGVAIGIAGALALSRVVAKLIYGVSPTDPVTLVAVALLLATVAFLASVIPAIRATKVEPMVALHEE
ncbi:MAG: ABC transporter permease [Candidatus Acidiferrales bacterium]